eukprot:4173638-Ditylum_brightwellii.AAC.1
MTAKYTGSIINSSLNSSEKSCRAMICCWAVYQANHMLELHDPTDMNKQFTYGSQLSSNILTVDSHE